MVRTDGLRFKLTAALVLVAAVPLLVSGAASLALGREGLRREIESRNVELARAIAGEVERALQRERQELAEIAVHVEGVGAGASPAALSLALTAGRGGNPAFSRVHVLDRRDRVVASSPESADDVGNDLSRLPYVAAARATGRSTWSSATVLLDTGEPKVGLVLPRAGYTLLAYLDLSSLVNAVANGAGPERSVALLDREGTFLAHQDASLARERVSLRGQPLVAGALAGREGTAEFPWRGRSWLGSAVPVRDTGWVVLVAEPSALAFASSGHTLTVLASLLLVVLAAAGALGLAFSRRLAQPIEALSARAGEVAAGSYDRASEPAAGMEVREIAQLARSFAAMAGEVRAREEALARSERELRGVLDNDLFGILRTLDDGTILFANPGMARIVGAASPDQLRGRSILPLYVDPAQRDALLREVQSSGRVANLEVGLRGLDGHERTVLVNMTADGGRLTTLLVDLTDLRRAAADRERLEEELRHAQKMEAMGRLAGGVAHDFNNLLTAIIGFSGLLEGAVPPAGEDRQSLDGIRQAAERASHLTQSLLAFSRKQVLHRRRVDLCEVVEAVEKLLRRIIGEDVLLTVSLPGEPLVVEADVSQLEQVLVNLATNARDAMPGGGTLGIAADAVVLEEGVAAALGLRRGGRFVRLTVEDTGQGIPDALRDRIFDPFFTTKPAGKGTGLGLSIVDGIVRQHAGHVAVESVAGKGTTFTILLEREEAVDARPAAAAPSAARRGRETILLAEDEPLVRKAFRRTLERAGYTVVEAVDGAAAVELFQREPARFDLCLVDMVMPRANGRETAAAIRALRADVPVLLASGYAADVLADRGQLVPGAELVTKPIPPAELLAKVRELLDR